MAKLKVLVDRLAAEETETGHQYDALDGLLAKLASCLTEQHRRSITRVTAFEVEYFDAADLAGKIIEHEDEPVLFIAPNVGLELPDNFLHIHALVEPRFDPLAKQAVIAALEKEDKKMVVSDLDDTALNRKASLELRETKINPEWLAFIMSHVVSSQNCTFVQMTARIPESMNQDREQYERGLLKAINSAVASGSYTRDGAEQKGVDNMVLSASLVMREIRKMLPTLFPPEGNPPLVFTSGVYKWCVILCQIQALPEDQRPGYIVLMDDQEKELNPEGPGAMHAKTELMSMGITVLSLRMQQRGEMLDCNFDAIFEFVNQHYQPPVVPVVFAQPKPVDTSGLLCEERLGWPVSRCPSSKRKAAAPPEDYEDDDGDTITVDGSAPHSAERQSKKQRR